MRLLTVHAHPDDEASKGAATTARYVAEGHQVRIVTCTGGERGDVLNPRLAHDPEVLANLSEIRRAEMAAAIEALGAELYSRYLMPFELAGLILLVALIGAIVLTHRSRGDARGQNAGRQIGRRPQDAVRNVNQPVGEGVVNPGWQSSSYNC